MNRYAYEGPGGGEKNCRLGMVPRRWPQSRKREGTATGRIWDGKRGVPRYHTFNRHVYVAAEQALLAGLPSPLDEQRAKPVIQTHLDQLARAAALARIVLHIPVANDDEKVRVGRGDDGDEVLRLDVLPRRDRPVPVEHHIHPGRLHHLRHLLRVRDDARVAGEEDHDLHKRWSHRARHRAGGDLFRRLCERKQKKAAPVQRWLRRKLILRNWF